jgi:hypothetical protein
MRLGNIIELGGGYLTPQADWACQVRKGKATTVQGAR